MNNKTASRKSLFSRIFRASAYFWAFLIMFIIFAVTGFSTMGSIRSLGKALNVEYGNNRIAVYNLNYNAQQSRLKEVYVNIGNVYITPGKTFNLTVKRSTSSSSKPDMTVGSVSIANIYSNNNSKQGANFNWIPVAVDKNYSASCISVYGDADFQLNEIVCIGDDEKIIPMSVNNKLTQGYEDKDLLNNAIDSPKSFIKNNSGKYNFSANEIYYMSSIKTIMDGSEFVNRYVYTIDKDFNSLATLIMLPSVAIFGTSTFALRFTPFLASCVTMILIYMLATMIFKKEKYGFIASLVYAFSGISLTVGMLGTPHAILACFILASLYCMFRFFSKGISSDHIVKGGLNVLFSGIFAALAMSMNILAFIPTIGIIVLFVFGMRRQKMAHINIMSKQVLDEDVNSEETPVDDIMKKGIKDNEKIYAYKNKLTISFALVSFIITTFLFILISSVISYPAYIKVYDNPASPSLGFGTILWKGISAPFKIDNITSLTSSNVVSVASWLLPIKSAIVYDGILKPGISSFISKSVYINSFAAIFALIAFSYTTVTIIFNAASKKTSTKEDKRNIRCYFILLGGMLTSMLMYAFIKNVSAIESVIFAIFYLGFIPLAISMGQPSEKKTNKNGKAVATAADIISIISLVIMGISLVLSLPIIYGFTIPYDLAKGLVGWMDLSYIKAFFFAK